MKGGAWLGGLCGLVAATAVAAQEPSVNTLAELRKHLGACISRTTARHPAIAEPAPGMMITMRFSLNRWGALLGVPSFTFRGIVHDARRVAYLEAIAAAISHCTPVNVTDGLGGAIAGRPILFTYTETRGQRAV